MRPFASECDLGAGAIELRTPRDELLDTVRAFFHQDARSLFVAQAVTRLERVLQVEADFVVVAKRGGDATLRVLRVGCLLYTSDAADEEDSVDLGGRSIIKKK